VGFEEKSRRDYFLKRRRGFLIKVAFALSCSVHLTRTDPLSNFKSVSYGLSKIQICSKFKLVRFPQIEQSDKYRLNRISLACLCDDFIPAL
jgi:hypothetical protein